MTSQRHPTTADRPRPADPHVRTFDSPHLRRVPEADRRDPASSPPRALWFERTVHEISDGQYRLVVPCILPVPVDDGIHAALTDELRRRWLGPNATRPWQITGVVAAFERFSADRAHLTLAITAARNPTAHRAGVGGIDDLAMAHDLGTALTGLGAVAVPAPAGRPA